jgi:hypothetical protein
MYRGSSQLFAARINCGFMASRASADIPGRELCVMGNPCQLGFERVGPDSAQTGQKLRIDKEIIAALPDWISRGASRRQNPDKRTSEMMGMNRSDSLSCFIGRIKKQEIRKPVISSSLLRGPWQAEYLYGDARV